MKKIKIRPYQKEDWPVLAHIHDRARREELEWAGLLDAFIPFAEASVRERLFDGYTVCVALLEEDLCGFAAYSDEELGWLYVDPAHQRQGVGKALVEHVINRTKRPLKIEVLKGNDPALSFYQSMGFSVLQTCSGKMPGNESFEVTVYCMEKE